MRAVAGGITGSAWVVKEWGGSRNGGKGRVEGKEGRIKSSFGVKAFDRSVRNYQLVTLQNVGPQHHKAAWEATVGGLSYNAWSPPTRCAHTYAYHTSPLCHPKVLPCLGLALARCEEKQQWVSNDWVWWKIIVQRVSSKNNSAESFFNAHAAEQQWQVISNGYVPC